MKKGGGGFLLSVALHSSTRFLEISEHLQGQRCGADKALSFVQCLPVKIPSLLVSVENNYTEHFLADIVNWGTGTKSHFLAKYLS